MKKPSVTQLLDLLAKPALIGWANKQGLAGIDIEISRKKTLEAGTSIHSQIENYCKGEGDFINDIDRTRFCDFKRDKKLVCVEKEIETEWFIGRYDVKFEHNGKHVIVDYKSGFKGKVYLENKLQLIAYTMAEPAEMAIVSAPQFFYHPVVIADRAPYENLLKNLSNIYFLKKEIEKEGIY
jgi:hypothetical protein